MITLRSSRLLAEIDDSAPDQLFPRWSRAGFVRQVVLDGRHAFCGVEIPNGNGGAGLCQEFNMNDPPGFAACPVGGWFLKPGVGRLQRQQAAAYCFYHRHPCRPVTPRREAAADRARWVMVHEPEDGIGLRLEQELVAEGASLRATCTARDLGGGGLLLQEYRHDFLAPGGEGVLPGRRLRFDRPLRPLQEGAWPGLDADRLGTTIEAPVGRRFHQRIAELGADAPTAWHLEDPVHGLAMSMATDRPWSRFVLFATARQFSPEVFLTLALPPGGEVAWTRTWTFAGPP